MARWVEDALRSGPPIIYLFSGKHTPEIMYQPFAGRDVEIQVNRYLAGPYLLDPFHNASIERVPSGLYCLKDLAPDKFQQTQYFREFYRYANLVDEICFISQVAGCDSYIVVSVARSEGQRAFTKDEVFAARRADGFVQVAVRKHCAQAARSSQPQQGLSYRAMEDFGYPVLTHREREIVGLILRGHSSKSAGAYLHISAETVRNHRKRIYSKLGVASQAELFLRFITQVFGSPASAGHP
jgi:DNA-binding CsgD family transcriptional regulator